MHSLSLSLLISQLLSDVRKSSEQNNVAEYHYRVKPTNPNVNASIVEITVQIFVTFCQFLLAGLKKAYLYPYDAVKSLMSRLSKLLPLQLKGKLTLVTLVDTTLLTFQRSHLRFTTVPSLQLNWFRPNKLVTGRKRTNMFAKILCPCL